ncbi:MAG: transposase, partial [Acidobacteriales bacterium]|nr:transposase [Terriglobales bacterium]
MSEAEAWMYRHATTRNAWSPSGQTPIIGTDPGRAKAALYGTLDLRTGQELVSRSGLLNARASAQPLSLILQAIPDQPILLFWDRAPWPRGQPIRQLLHAQPRLTIIEYPVAAPDLNPQEPVWKQTRRAVSHNHPIPKLPNLADRFEQHLTNNTFPSSFVERYGFYRVCPF